MISHRMMKKFWAETLNERKKWLQERSSGISSVGNFIQQVVGSGPVHTYPEICENANFFYEYGLHPHVFSSRVWKSLKTLSRVEIFLSDTNTYTCGRSYPEIFEYAYVILLAPVFTASIVNKPGVQQGCSFFVSCSDF